MAKSEIDRSEKQGSSTVDRLAGRLDRSKLKRRAMGDGGEVFTGQVASRALKALGARAMTVDNSIIVSESFDPNKAEDAAVYAHEQFHLEGSGGVGDNDGHDQEEAGARQVERMVLHRMSGGVESHEAEHTSNPGGAQGGGASKGKTSANGATAFGAYAAMLESGMNHGEIVEQLAQQVLQSMQTQRDHHGERSVGKKGFA